MALTSPGDVALELHSLTDDRPTSGRRQRRGSSVSADHPSWDAVSLTAPHPGSNRSVGSDRNPVGALRASQQRGRMMSGQFATTHSQIAEVGLSPRTAAGMSMMSRGSAGSSRESGESDDETTTDGATATAASRDGDSNGCRGSTARSLDSAAVSIFMLVITLFVLYIDDLVVVLAIRRQGFDEEYLFLVLKNICFVIFAVELGVTSWAKPREYFLRFFFWLDVIALISFLPDVSLFLFSYDIFASIGGLAVARTGRAARASARAARLVRVVRVVKVAKVFQKQTENSEEALTISTPNLDPTAAPEARGTDLEPSRVGNRLIASTTNKVIAMILLLFLAATLMQVPDDCTPFMAGGLDAISQAVTTLGSGDPLVAAMIPSYTNVTGGTLAVLAVGGEVLVNTSDVSSYQEIFVAQAVLGDVESPDAIVVHLLIRTERIKAALSMAVITFVIILLVVGNLLISNDANRLIIIPVERVVEVVKLLTRHVTKRQRQAAKASRAGGDGAAGDDHNEAEALLDMLNEVDAAIRENQSETAAQVEVSHEQQRIDFLNTVYLEMEMRKFRRAVGRDPLAFLGDPTFRAEFFLLGNPSTRVTVVDRATVDAMVFLATNPYGPPRYLPGVEPRPPSESDANDEADRIGNGGGGDSTSQAQTTAHLSLLPSSSMLDNERGTGWRDPLMGSTPITPLLPSLRRTQSDDDLLDFDFDFDPNPNRFQPPPGSSISVASRSSSSVASRSAVIGGAAAPNAAAVAAATGSSSASSASSASSRSEVDVVDTTVYEPLDEDDFVHVFLLTFREYIEPLELMERLVSRYTLGPHNTFAEYDVDAFVQTQTQARIVHLVEVWLSNYFFDFCTSTSASSASSGGGGGAYDDADRAYDDGDVDGHKNALLHLMSDFVMRLLPAAGHYDDAAHLRELLEAKSRGETGEVEVPPPPPPMIGLGDPSLATWEPIEMARQLSLIEYDLYAAIRPEELMDVAWTRKDAATRAPHVLALISHFNAVSTTVQGAILAQESIRQRAFVLAKFIDVAQALYDMRNFNGVFEMISSLNAAGISRLKRTWREVPRPTMERLELISTQMSALSSYKSYRALQESDKAMPSIPYIGVALGDLISIDEGNADEYRVRQGDGGFMVMANVSKCYQIAGAIRGLLAWQHLPYAFIDVGDIAQFWSARGGPTDKELYAMSLEREPRSLKTVSQRLRTLSSAASAFARR